MRYAFFKDHKQWFVYDNHTKKILPTPYNTKAEARAAARTLEEAEERANERYARRWAAEVEATRRMRLFGV